MCDTLTAKQVAEKANIDIRTVYRLCEEGVLPARNVGTRKRHVWRIHAEEFERWLRGK